MLLAVPTCASRTPFAAAYAYLAGQSDAAIYFYSKYERTVYRKLQAKYPEVCDADAIERLFDPARAVDLYGDVVMKATEWPTPRPFDQDARQISRLYLARCTSFGRGIHRVVRSVVS